MVKRTPIGKTKRFAIFMRDGFSCRYCNQKPPQVVLEVDHVIPVSKGGCNDDFNLVTACFDCNRGKRTTILERNSGINHIEVIERQKEALSQYKAYIKSVKEKQILLDESINMVEEIYNSVYSDWFFGVKFRLSVAKFINEIGLENTMDAMRRAASKRLGSSACLSYFCGICWNLIKERP